MYVMSMTNAKCGYKYVPLYLAITDDHVIAT